MCFYCILKGLFCIGEGAKTWAHGREQAILIGQFLGYLCLLVFSEKRNRLTCWFFSIFFFFFFFCWTMCVLLEYRNPKTNILPFSLLQTCKYDDFYSIFNVGKKQKCDTVKGVSGKVIVYLVLKKNQLTVQQVTLGGVLKSMKL